MRFEAVSVEQADVGRGGNHDSRASANDCAQGKRGRLVRWSKFDAHRSMPKSMEARPRRIQHNDFNLAMAAGDRRYSGDSGISPRLFRTNFDGNSSATVCLKISRICRICSNAMRNIAPRWNWDETVCRFASKTACFPTRPEETSATASSRARRSGQSTIGQCRF